MPRFSSPCKPGLMTSAFWFSQITMTLMSRRSLSMRRCLLFWEEDRDSTHTRVYLRFPFSHPTNMGVSSFTRAWSDCVGNPGFDKRSTWHDNSLTKGSMVGGGGGDTFAWSHSGFLKVQPQMHHESPWECLLGGETECHLSEQTLLLQKHPGGFLRGQNPRPLSRCFKDRVWDSMTIS